MRGTHSGVWVHVSVCPCLCLCPVRVRQGDMASRLAHSGSENVASGAGEVRALWGLSFAPCKMGITIAACPRRLLRSSNETVDLNSKEPFELSSVSGCAHGCVGVRASERLCRELPATPFSCRDKSAVSSVPSHQKYTRFWPRAMLSNSPGGGGMGSGGGGLQGGALHFWAGVAISSLTVRPSPCKGTEATSASSVRLGPLWHETVSPLSYWALLGARNHFPFSLFLPQKNREVVTQCGCGSFCVRAGHLWGCVPGLGFRVWGVLAARGLPCRV